MPGEGYRTLLDCRRRSRALRARSVTFDQIAHILALDHDVSPLRLYRYAHGRTAGDVVAARSLLTDEIYARYNAAHRDLLDQADYRHLDPHQQLTPPPPTPSDAILPKGRPTAQAPRHEGLPTWTLAPTPGPHDSIERHFSGIQPPTPAHCTELLRALRAEETDVDDPLLNA
ncbi:hypothetical protein ABT352_29130 [Streptosporangium sp. NPDC000563]|uniref:hypothetical protein n=1 Tax=Streptosporangium sp. NPDC000563 TaxID=3154366 RepID=UPI00332B3BA4